MPPELHGCDLQRDDRTVEHDRFGLAVLMFLLLMEGVHPFDGNYANPDDTSQRWDRMRVGHFAFGGGLSILQPPPFALPYTFLPPEIRALVSECFVAGHIDPGRRPSAQRWRDALRAMDAGLIQCNLNENHWLPVHLRGICPWCERREDQDGNDPFPGSREEPRLTPKPGAPEQQPLVGPVARPVPAGGPSAPVRRLPSPNGTPLERTVVSDSRPIRLDPPASGGAARAAFVILMALLTCILAWRGFPAQVVVVAGAVHISGTAVCMLSRSMWRWPVWLVGLVALSVTLYVGAGALQSLTDGAPNPWTGYRPPWVSESSQP